MTCPRPWKLRRGLSRVEVALILAILALLAGMLAAAVGRVREADTRAKCQNNLKQLALALHNYNDTSGRLPPLIAWGDAPADRADLRSAFAALIPYLEATVLQYRPGSPPAAYHAPSSVAFPVRDNDESLVATQGGGDANQFARWFLCPADATAGRRDVPVTLPDGTTGHYATGSYAANGLVPWGVSGLPLGPGQTVLVAERPQVCRTAEGVDVPNLWGVGSYGPHLPAFAALTPADPPGLPSTGLAAPALPMPPEGAADRDALVRVRVGLVASAPRPPDFPAPIQSLRPGRPCDPRLPGSSHRGVMLAAMADGAVRAIAADTPQWVFWSLCTASVADEP